MTLGTNRIAVFVFAFGVLHAQNSEQVLIKGIEEFHKGQYSTALDTLKHAVELSPADARAITFLALTRAATGDCAHALDELILQSKRISDPAVRRLAGLASVQCLLARNDFKSIFPILSDLLADAPNDPDVLYEAAKVYNKAWNEMVYEMFQRTPASYRVNQLSAEIFETQSRYAEAGAEYRKAIEKNPKAVNLHFRLGRAILLESHSPEALELARREFEAELGLNPSDAAAEYQVAQILVAEQKPAEAGPHYEKAVALNQKFPEALVALGKLRASTKQYDDAIRLLQRAIEAAPAMEAAHYALMMAYRDSGKTQDAAREKAELDKLQKPPEGEFTDFLKKLGEKAPKQ